MRRGIAVAAASMALLLLAPGRADERPHWIWGAEERSAGQRFVFERTLTLNGPPEAATLRLAVDFATCELTVNGERVAELDEYAPWLTMDLVDRLRAGENHLEFACVAGEGPAALAFSLHATTAGGETVEIVSDEGWTAKIQEKASEFGDAASFAVSVGEVAPELWDSDASARVSAFDDYEQWRQATNAAEGPDPATFVTRPGFAVDLVRNAQPGEGSWVSMAFDPEGRLTIAREEKGLLRMTLSKDGGRVEQVESIEDELLESRGLLYAHDALYASANNSRGLYRLRDVDGDGRFEEKKLLRELPGGVGHGRNDLALGPDGGIYWIHGDSVEAPTENVVDRTSPFREARRGARTEEGFLLRTDKEGARWELLAAGMRNPFGVDFDQRGEAFTYDADAEFDMGTPWYRPTRIDHLVSGADFGWRGRTGEWPPFFPDSPANAPPTVDVGEGSPTAAKSGAKSSFPGPYRRAMFVLDWAYGRVLTCHLSPRGAGFACRVEQFLKGRPLNVTDLDFGPDGSLYLVTGGRKTQSALYRVRYVKPDDQERPSSRQEAACEEYSARARALRKKLESFHERRDGAIPEIWPCLGNPDPAIRQAARVALEHQPVDHWRDKALKESDAEIAASALLSLARSGEQASFDEALARASELDSDILSTCGRLTLIETYRLLLDDRTELDGQAVAAAEDRLLRWLAEASSTGIAPLGSGDRLSRELARLASDLELEAALRAIEEQLDRAASQIERMHALFAMRNLLASATSEQRTKWFEDLRQLELSAYSGEGMPAFLRRLREDATKGLSDEQRDELGELLNPASLATETSVAVDRPIVRKWTLAEAIESVENLSHTGNVERGLALFREANCATCHRLHGRGGVVGPDLSSAAQRFSRQDLLASIVEPSQVVAERYRGVRVETTDGRIIVGRLLTEGDYRRSVVRIVEDSLQPGKVTEIAKSDIERSAESPLSVMPTGLLDSFTDEEIIDLLAALTAPPSSSPGR